MIASFWDTLPETHVLTQTKNTPNTQIHMKILFYKQYQMQCITLCQILWQNLTCLLSLVLTMPSEVYAIQSLD